MCVRALCLVVMVSVNLNCLLWVNHTAFIFSFFRASVFEDSIGWPLPGPLQKISHTRHLSVSYMNLTRLWLPLSSAWKKISNFVSSKIGLEQRFYSYDWLQTDLLFSSISHKSIVPGHQIKLYSLPAANIVKRYSVLKFLAKVRKMHKKLAILRSVNNSAPRHPKFLRLAFLCTWVCVLNTLWMPSHLDNISFSPFWPWPSLILFDSARHGIRL